MEVENEQNLKEEYLMLAHELPEDQSLREKLQRERLVSFFSISFPNKTTNQQFLKSFLPEFGVETTTKGKKR